MKSFFPLFLLPFLCVKCCPWDDCEGADFLCVEFLPVLPQLTTAIPYQDGEMLLFRFEDDPEVVSIDAFRNEGLIGSQECQDEILAVLQTDGPDRRFRLSLSTDTNGESQLRFVFSFGPLTQGNQEFFNLEYDEQELAGVRLPLQLRVVADTILAEVDYRDVAILTVPDVTDTGKINSFYYTRTDGLLRVERLNAPAFFRVN